MLGPAPDGTDSAPVCRLTCPESFHIDDIDFERRRLIYRWFTWPCIFLIEFAIVWNAFCCVFAFIMWRDFQHWFQIAFFLFFPGIGVWLAYFCLASLINKTTFSIAGGALIMRHGPVPWPGNVVLITAQICGFGVTSREAGLILSEAGSLLVVLADGKERTLLTLTVAEALFAARQLEKWLQLPTGGKPDGLPTLRQAHSH